jgi:uncharacterized cupredoxin-like copper-binding protein/Cu/Ag efflux protein CusF
LSAQVITMKHHLLLASAFFVACLGSGAAYAGKGHASSLGKAGDPSKVNRTVFITMNDSMRFSPSAIAVQRNDTVRFVIKNEGKLKHEMVLGTLKELKAHAALMRKFPNMEHADPNQASVEPGKTGELVWQFTKGGNVDFACLQAGHYEAGMRGKIAVGAALKPASAAVAPAAMVIAAAPTPPSASPPSAALTDGEVRRVDIEAGKITLKHAEIKNLDMPGMTMVFAVKDKAQLDRLKAGDKVTFAAEKINGNYVVTQIVRAP